MFRAAINFQHCAKTNNPVVGNQTVDWATTSGYNISGTNYAVATAIDSLEGWLGSYNPSNYDVIVAFPTAGKSGQNPNKVTLGFRLKTLAVYANAHSVVHISDPASPTSIAYYLYLAGGAAAPWTPAIGSSVHCEFTLDINANKVFGLINGNPIADYTPPAMPAAVKTALLNGTAVITFRLATTVGGRYAVKDITWLDDIEGDGITGPIGAQQLVPVYVDDVTGADNYAKSDSAKTPLQHLNTALPTVTTLTSPTTKDPITVSLKADIPTGARILALDLNYSGRSTGDSRSPVKAEISQGGVTLAAKQTYVATTMTYGVPLAVLAKAPDGGLWTAAKIDATSVKLTPDTIV